MRLSATYRLILALVLTAIAGQAADAPPTEYQVKAAFIFNFAKFVQWPSNAFDSASSPMIVGVLGENPFGRDLELTVSNKMINERPLIAREFTTASQIAPCHVLFVAPVEMKQFPEVLRMIGDMSVLTVGESADFLEAGGMIKFVKEGNKIRFQINEAAARKAGLKISSKLLGLAVPVSR